MSFVFYREKKNVHIIESSNENYAPCFSNLWVRSGICEGVLGAGWLQNPSLDSKERENEQIWGTFHTKISDITRFKRPLEIVNFPSSLNFEVTVDQDFVLKSCFCVLNIIVEFNQLSKTGLESSNRQSCAEISKCFGHNINKITTFTYPDLISHKISGLTYFYF